MAQHIHGAELIELAAQALEQGGLGFGAVVLLEHLPGIGLGLLHPGDQIGRIKGELAVVVGGIAQFV